MLNEERPQDFELIELLIKEGVTGAPSEEFKSFRARFQSYIDQMPSYLHSVNKEEFFSHFFLGSFSTLLDTQIAEKLGVEKIYFRFSEKETLKVAVIKKGKISPDGFDVADKIKLFSISKRGARHQEFDSGNLDNIFKKLGLDQKVISKIKDPNRAQMKFKLAEISRDSADKHIRVEVRDKKVESDLTGLSFHEIKKGLWQNPENYIERLADVDVRIVRKSTEGIFRRISKVYSEYKGSFLYEYGPQGTTKEAAHHGFVAGIFAMNFHYRYNLRVYLEQFAGRGYSDIILLARGKERSLNSVPIIIELKAGTATPNDGLEQAKGYAKGFQPNTMRILTTSDNVLCIGLNLDSTQKFSTYLSPRDDREPDLPTIQKLLEVSSDWNGRENTAAEVEEKIKQPLERIYHTFPGTPEKRGNYFSRFLLGQLIHADEFKRVNLEKSIFLYDEYPLSLEKRSGVRETTGRPVTTLMLTRKGHIEEVFVFHIREGGRGERSDKKIPIPKVNRITEVYIKVQEGQDPFNIEEIKRYNSVDQYREGKELFKGKLERVPYPNELKETFDAVLDSQRIHRPGQPPGTPVQPVTINSLYQGLLKKIAEGAYPLQNFVGAESDFQGVLHGAFSYYSDLKLQEPLETRTLVLTEFQTGRGKRTDMLVHGIEFQGGGANAKEYTPMGLELKGPRSGVNVDALKKEANDQIASEYKKGVTYKTLTDGDEVNFIGVVFNKGAGNADSLMLISDDNLVKAKVCHSSVIMPIQDLAGCLKQTGRNKRSISMPCIDSRDEEKITKKEKAKLIKELFGIEAYDTKIITIDSPQVSIDSDKVNIKFKDNIGNDKELIIDDATNIKSIGNYILDNENLEIKLKVSSDKEYAIIEEIKGQGIEHYLNIDGYKVKLDSIIKDFITDPEREKIHNKLHQLSNDKQLLENKKYIEDIGDVQTNQDYSNIVEEIRQNLLAKGVREDTFDRFKSHFDDLGEKVFADYISNVESSLQEKGIAFDRDKFDSAKIKGAKGGKFFSMMAIYDLLDSIGDTATLGRHNNDALKQVFGINGILDAMDDVRTSVSISPNSKVGKLIGKVPQPVRQTFVKIISNPIVQSITFATIAYQFGYSVNEIAQGDHHPLNYYWTASSVVKLASMSIRPISAGVSFTIKSVSATTKILRGLFAAGKVLGRASVVTMVADVLITMGVKIHERMEYTKAIAEQVPLLPGGEQAEVFFAGVIKFFTRRDVEKEYEDTIRIKGYLTYVKEAAIKLLNDNYDIDAVVQYVISIEEKYSEVIKNMGAQAICIMPSPYGPGCATQMKWTCDLEKKYDNISSDKINTASNVKNDLFSLDISKALPMIPYTLNMRGFECTLPVLGTIAFPAESFIANKCLQESYEKEKVYIVNTEAKHIPHLTKYEYKDLGLRIVDAPLTNPIQKSQCSKTINTKHKGDDAFAPCNSGKIYRNCQESFTLSGEPFIFTNPTRKEHSNTKKQTFPRGSVLYISGPKTLTAAANYPAVMHIPEGSNIRYVGSKNNETIFIINDYTSCTLEGGPGKENTLVMNVKANNVVANLHGRTIRYGNSNNIRLVNTYNYVSNSDSKQNITTHCKTRLINVKNAEVWQNSFNCTDKDYEVRVVNKENVHNRELKQTIFVVNEDSDNAKIVSDLGSTGKIKGNIDIIKVQVANITKWGISEDIEKVGYSLDVLANNTQSIVSSTKINDFKNLVIQVNSNGITESVAIQDKSLSDTIEDIRYQELKSSGSDISREVIQNSAKKLKAFIQASILDQELLDTYQIAKDIVNNNNFDIPVSQVEVIKNHMGVPSEKVIIAGMYSGQVIVDFSYSSSDVTSNYQKYLNGGRNYGYDDYLMLCNYYQDITIEGEKGQHQYIIKLPDTLNSKTSLSPIRLNLKIKNKVVSYQNIPYSIIDFAELSVTDVDGISIEEGKRDYINECYGKSISDLTEDSLKIQDITLFDSVGTKWSLSIGLVDYFQNPENQQIVLRINNELYKIDSTNSKLENVEMDPNSFRYYQPDEQGLQIYHNQPIDKNDIGLVDFRDKSILDFDAEITDDSLVLSHKNNTLVKVENWNTYQPAREMMFGFSNAIVSNSECIASICNSEDVVVKFNKEKLVLSTEQLFDAVKQNNLDKVKELINQGARINAQEVGIYGKEPIHSSESVLAKQQIIDKISSMVKNIEGSSGLPHRGVNIDNETTYQGTPLHFAVQEGNLDIVEFLLDRGADIESQDMGGQTPLDLATREGYTNIAKILKQAQLDNELLTAVKKGDLPKVRESVNRGASVKAKDKLGRPLLVIAAQNHYFYVMEFLVDRNADIEAKDNDGATSLHWSAVIGLSDMVKYLIRKGANIEAKDMGGQTPLDLATREGYTNIAKILKQAQLDNELLTAVKKGDLPKVRESVNRGASVKAKDKLGRPLLVIAAQNYYFYVMEFLVDRNADIEAKDNDGATSLHWSAVIGLSDMVKYLIRKGANIEAKDMGGQTPLDLATKEGHTSIVRILKQAKLDQELLTVTEIGGLSKVANFINQGSDINAKGKDGNTPLYSSEKSNDSIKQRKRRHHHGDYSFHHLSRKYLSADLDDQPEIAMSGGTRPSSWIRGVFDWVNKGAERAKSLVGGWLTGNTTVFKLGGKERILKTGVSEVDKDGTILLLDTLIRKVNGQKHTYSNERIIPEQEARGYAINIVEGFEKIIERAARNNKISMSRLDIDFFKVQGEVTNKISSGKYGDILEVLNEYAEKACPDREVGSPGRLSPKKFDRFMTELNNKLDMLVNESISRMIDGKSNMFDVKEQQEGSKPRSCLDNVSVLANSTQVRGLT